MAEALNNGNRNKKIVRNFVDDGRRAPYPKECPECGSKNIVNNPAGAEIYCGDCGIVIAKDMIDPGPEWRAYDKEEKDRKARTGTVMTYRIHDKGLSTALLPKKMLSKSKKPQWLLSSQERTHILALKEIERMSSALILPEEIIERAAYLYQEAMKKNLIRGQSVEKIVSAILWIVCRQNEISRDREEIAAISKIGGKKKAQKITKLAKKLLEKLELKIKPASPIEFVPRLCSKLGLNGEIQSKAIEIIEEVLKKELISGQQPKTIASVAIFIAIDICNEHRTEEEIAKVCGVTTVTLRSNRKILEKALSIEIPKEQSSAQEIIDEIYSHLDFYRETIEKERIKRRAVEIMNEAEKIKRENGKREKYREALAAAAIATAVKEKYGSNFPITKKIAEAVKIDILRIRYREKQIKKQK